MKDKNTEKKFVGQPIFKQIIDFIPKDKFALLVRKHNADHYYKSFDSWTHLVTLLFGIFSRCDSMGEICDDMQALDEKLNHLRIDKSPAKSTAGDGLRNRIGAKAPSLPKSFYPPLNCSTAFFSN